jgi:hypothetical protein
VQIFQLLLDLIQQPPHPGLGLHRQLADHFEQRVAGSAALRHGQLSRQGVSIGKR